MVKAKTEKTLFYENFLSRSKKLSDFLNNHKERNNNTYRAYRLHLVAFFKYHKINNIDNYIKDTRLMEIKDKIIYLNKIEKDITKYWNYINFDKKHAFKGKTPYIFLSAIKEFLKNNNTLELDKLWSNTKKNGHGNHSVTNYDTPNKEQLIKIFNQGDIESKALFMVQITSGQRISQIVNLTFDNIELDKEYPRLYWPSSKSKNSIKSRITPEAKKYLMQYLDQRDKFIEIRKKRGEFHRETEIDTNKVFPMTEGNAESIWRTMVTNAGLYKIDTNTKKPIFGTHCLRRFFLSNFIGREWGDYFAGHITPRNREYNQYTHQQLDKEYIERSKNLNILTDNAEEIEQIKIISEKLESAEKKNKEYEERLNKYENKLTELKDYIYDREYSYQPPNPTPYGIDDSSFIRVELNEESYPIFYIADKEKGIIPADYQHNQRLIKIWTTIHPNFIKELIKEKQKQKKKNK